MRGVAISVSAKHLLALSLVLGIVSLVAQTGVLERIQASPGPVSSDSIKVGGLHLRMNATVARQAVGEPMRVIQNERLNETSLDYADTKFVVVDSTSHKLLSIYGHEAEIGSLRIEAGEARESAVSTLKSLGLAFSEELGFIDAPQWTTPILEFTWNVATTQSKAWS
jgi:hypothetical protein